jgi:eukaryotic-like serine/threonine-protein kinase
LALTSGARLGPYEILSALGAGGMGEVYRARDPTLGREVALKVLPAIFMSDPHRVARFRREAKTLALLNHPNIGGIYGLEEVNNVTALVLELVEGPTLADRIARGPIPRDEALSLARQIADALESAHGQGIIHRDLKPANIKVRSDGVVKVLDFGLATTAPSGVGRELSLAPTLTAAAITHAGVIVGTPAYMSPEQAHGRPVDERSDVWALGCVIYEALTGRRAFEGESVSGTLAAVLGREPHWEALPATLTPAFCVYLKRCLHKDPKQRVQSVGDLRLALAGAFDVAGPPLAVHDRPHAAARLAFGAAVLIAIGVLLGALAATWVATPVVPPPVSRLEIVPSGAATLNIGWNDRDLAITPDGSHLVYVGNQGTQIFVRAFDALAPMAVFTGAPRGLFVSPDSQWIGFNDSQGVLKKVAVTGGPAATLGTPDTAGSTGGTWGPDDTIILATNHGETGLQRVSASGGRVAVLTRPDRARGEADHFWPEMLPDGHSVLFTIMALTGGLDAAQVAVLDLRTNTYRTILRGGSHAHYVSSGHLVYAAAGTLRAVPFDLSSLQMHGTPVPVLADVVMTNSGAVDAVVADDGTLVYVPGSLEGTPRTLVWVDLAGRETAIAAPPRPYLLPDLSPDGLRLVLFANDRDRDLWLWDLARTTLTRLTAAAGVDVVQVWTPDSRRIIFTSERAGVRNLFSQAADGTGDVMRLTDSPNTQYPMAVSPDGRTLIFSEEFRETGIDMMTIELGGTHQVAPLVRSPFTERNGTISPDGHWLAYEANDSGPFEIYVRPFPDVNRGRWQLSTDGGSRPRWSRGGKELVYVSPAGAIMGVDLATGPSRATPPSVRVKEGYYTTPAWWGRSYDVSPDGHRFLLIKERSTRAPGFVVVQHWDDVLKRLAR